MFSFFSLRFERLFFIEFIDFFFKEDFMFILLFMLFRFLIEDIFDFILLSFFFFSRFFIFILDFEIKYNKLKLICYEKK